MLSLPSFTFIPGWLYVPLFNGIIFLLVMTAVVHGFKGDIYRWNASRSTRFIGALLVLFLILYIGLRPTTSFREYPDFGDTVNYKRSILALKALNPPSWLSPVNWDGEWLYGCIESFSAFYADEHLAFLIAAIFYVGCAALFCKRTFGIDWFLPFLMICAAFTFFAYGVNGVRNGMAASMVILALSYRDKIWVAALLCFLAVGVHKSIYLLIAAAMLAWKITNPKIYIAGWVLCIMAAAAGGSSISTAIASSGFFDDPRLAGYGIRGASSDGFYTGFRADFLLYSALPIICGWYFFLRRGYRDRTFIWLYNIYITSNAFWVLMMYASFSNRFAQLSWFIMPIVLMYPWLKVKVWKDQSRRLAGFLLLCYAYSFLSAFILPYLHA